MKLYRAIYKDTSNNTFYQTERLFQDEAEILQWFFDHKTEHETWEDYYAYGKTDYIRQPFTMALMGAEEVVFCSNF